MGAHIYFKVPPEQAEAAGNFLQSLPEIKTLQQFDRHFGIYDLQDVEWAKQQDRPHLTEYIQARIGRGDWKASGIDDDEGLEFGVTYDRIFELVTAALEKLGQKFDLKIYSGSCAISDLCYFTEKQLRRITRDGELLSSKPPEQREEILALME